MVSSKKKTKTEKKNRTNNNWASVVYYISFLRFWEEGGGNASEHWGTPLYPVQKDWLFWQHLQKVKVPFSNLINPLVLLFNVDWDEPLEFTGIHKEVNVCIITHIDIQHHLSRVWKYNNLLYNPWTPSVHWGCYNYSEFLGHKLLPSLLEIYINTRPWKRSCHEKRFQVSNS